jgi:CRP-like cAMP-binding protein
MNNSQDTIINNLRASPTLSRLSDQDFQWIAKTGKTQTFNSQDHVINSGKICPNIYIILDGKLSLSVPSSTGENQQVAEVSPGELIGEIPLIDLQPSQINAQALVASQILTISQTELNKKFQEDQGFASRFYHTIALLISNRLKGISDLLARNKIMAGQPIRKVLLVFGELDGNDIDWMSKFGQGQKIDHDTILLQQGEPATALYILLEGSLGVLINIQDGDRKIAKEIAKLSTGEIVGEMSFLDGSNPSATVKAPENSFVLALPRASLAEKMQSDLGFATRFYRAFAIVLADRLKDRLLQRGFGQITYNQEEIWNEDIEFEDELDLDLLKNVSLAATRFDWLVKKMRYNC